MTKSRLNMYLPHEISDEVDRLAKKPGVTKSAVVEDILRRHFANKGELDGDAKERLAKLAKQLGRLEKHQLLLIEMLANYVRFYFSAVPPIPESEQRTGKTLAERRFTAFIDQVAHRRASGKGMVEALTRETGS